MINNNDFRNNDDLIDDIGDIAVNNVWMRPYNNRTNNHFNSSVHNGGVGPSDIRTNEQVKIKTIFLLITETTNLFLQLSVREREQHMTTL